MNPIKLTPIKDGGRMDYSAAAISPKDVTEINTGNLIIYINQAGSWYNLARVTYNSKTGEYRGRKIHSSHIDTEIAARRSSRDVVSLIRRNNLLPATYILSDRGSRNPTAGMCYVVKIAR